MRVRPAAPARASALPRPSPAPGRGSGPRLGTPSARPLSRPSLPSPARAARGQIIVSDLLISLSVFLVIILIFFWAWHRSIDRLTDYSSANTAEAAVDRALRMLVDAPGNPSNWAARGLNATQVLGLGLAGHPGALDPAKVARLETLYNDSTQYPDARLKLGLTPFEGDIRIYYPNGTGLAAMGAAPTSSSIVLASGQRLALMGNQTVLVRVRAWRDEG